MRIILFVVMVKKGGLKMTRLLFKTYVEDPEKAYVSVDFEEGTTINFSLTTGDEREDDLVFCLQPDELSAIYHAMRGMQLEKLKELKIIK